MRCFGVRPSLRVCHRFPRLAGSVVRIITLYQKVGKTGLLNYCQTNLRVARLQPYQAISFGARRSDVLADLDQGQCRRHAEDRIEFQVLVMWLVKE
jgi:hypothetical protein